MTSRTATARSQQHAERDQQLGLVVNQPFGCMADRRLDRVVTQSSGPVLPPLPGPVVTMLYGLRAAQMPGRVVVVHQATASARMPVRQRPGTGRRLGSQVLGELAAGGAGVIADPAGDLAGECGGLGPVAVAGVAGLAAALVEADQRGAFRLAWRQPLIERRVARRRPGVACGSGWAAGMAGPGSARRTVRRPLAAVASGERWQLAGWRVTARMPGATGATASTQ